MLDRFLRWLPWLGLVGAALLVVVLGIQNRALRADRAALRRQAMLPHAGMVVPTFRGVTLDGDSVTLGASTAGARQLLFVFDTSCPYCEEALGAWDAVAERVLRRPGVSVYGISLDSAAVTRQYAARHGLRFPVVTFPELKLVALYRASAYPLTLVVDDGGRVLHARLAPLRTAAAVDSVVAALAPDEHDTDSLS